MLAVCTRREELNPPLCFLQNDYFQTGPSPEAFKELIWTSFLRFDVFSALSSSSLYFLCSYIGGVITASWQSCTFVVGKHLCATSKGASDSCRFDGRCQRGRHAGTDQAWHVLEDGSSFKNLWRSWRRSGTAVVRNHLMWQLKLQFLKFHWCRSETTLRNSWRHTLSHLWPLWSSVGMKVNYVSFNETSVCLSIEQLGNSGKLETHLTTEAALPYISH